MNIWCPQCGSTRFSYTKLEESASPVIIKDHMRCKNPACLYEFKIEWYEPVRIEWIKQVTEARKKLFNEKNER